jgi:hypothetical protein
MVGKVKLERRDRLHRVCKHVIAGGPHNVDADIKAQFKSAVLRYAGTEYLPTEQAVKNLYQRETETGHLVREAFAVIDDASDTRKQSRDGVDEDVREGDDGGGVSNHHVSRLADLLVESGRFTDRGHALRHLTSHPDGVALVRTHKKDHPMQDSLTKLAKDIGVIGIAKAIVNEGRSYGIDEHEFTRLATDHAQRVYPDKTPDAAFAKLFTDNGADGVLLRKAHALNAGRHHQFERHPTTRMRSGSSPGRGDDSGDVDSVGVSDAYAQLTKLAEQQRRAGETASQAFARIYADPANKHLAEAERSANRPQPTTQYPFPR